MLNYIRMTSFDYIRHVMNRKLWNVKQNIEQIK